MKLLIIDKEYPPKSHGGIGAYNLALARALGQAGHFVVALSGLNGGKAVVTEEAYGVLVRAPYRQVQGGLGKYFRWMDALSFGANMLPQATQLQLLQRRGRQGFKVGIPIHGSSPGGFCRQHPAPEVLCGCRPAVKSWG